MKFLSKKPSRFIAEPTREYRPGDRIVREGDEGSALYIIQAGRVAVLKKVGNTEVLLMYLDPGAFFGEMSLLEGLPRSASVCATEPTRVLVIEPGALLTKIGRDPTLALEIMQQLSGRVRRQNEMIRRDISNDLSNDKYSIAAPESVFEGIVPPISEKSRDLAIT